MRGIIIAGTHSGVGKTTVSMGLLSALRSAGFRVQPFKVGPDYIDPMYHQAICGRPSYNLDTWMMGVDGVYNTFARYIADADMGVIEGVMGLFDGKGDGDGEGSTAHITKVLDLPVILVIDASKMAQSVAPLVYGFEGFDEDVKIEGVIFNRVGSERHYYMLKNAVLDRCSAKVLGYLPKDKDLYIPERHLGLTIDSGFKVQDSEFRYFLEKLTTLVEKYIDINGILSIPCNWKGLPALRSCGEAPEPEPRISIAIAMDDAFFFYYRENLSILEEMGAELVSFSPLKDKELPCGIGGIYIGGGYPELYGKQLSLNRRLMEEIRAFSEKGLPIYAECGGLIYLGRSLIDLQGKIHNMVGVFPWTSKMLKKRKALGYVELEISEDFPFLKKGERIRGHEFHYSTLKMDSANKETYRKVYNILERSSSFNMPNTDMEGYLYKKTLASYVHIHFASNKDLAKGFVKECRLFQKGLDLF